MLSARGLTPAMSELLAEKLAESYTVKIASSRQNKVLRLFDMLFAIIRFHRECSLVIMDVYSTSAFWYAICCTLLMKILKVSYITILRGGDLPVRLNRNPKLCKFVFGNAEVNVSPSYYLQRAFSGNGYRVEVIPNFIEMGQYPFRHREKVRPRLLWVRSFHSIYNPILAVKILIELRKQYVDAKLCMIGPDKDGSLKYVRTEVANSHLSDHVTFTGKLQKGEWIKKSTEFDVFINTTNYDNMPVSVLEAMALGFPVISTRVGGIPDLIEEGHNGLLVTPNDCVAFVNQVEKLLNDEMLTTRLSSNAREHAKRFSWEQVGSMWDKLIISNFQK